MKLEQPEAMLTMAPPPPVAAVAPTLAIAGIACFIAQAYLQAGTNSCAGFCFNTCSSARLPC